MGHHPNPQGGAGNPQRKVNPMAVAKTEIEKREAALQKMVDDAVADMTADEFDVGKMITDIMAAETLDDVLGTNVIGLRDIIGTPMTIHSAELQKSTFEDSPMPTYSVMRVEFDDGERALVTSGAVQVVAALVKFHHEGWFPTRVSSVAIETGSGNTVIKLTKPPTQ